MTAKKLTLWICQLLVVVILLPEAWAKLSGSPGAIYVFSELGMEPTGRFAIGIIEFCAACFLLTNRLAATGGLLAVGTMLGAIIAHVSILGISVGGDRGRHVILLAIVLISALIVTIVRRRQLPIIGSTFREQSSLP